MKGEDSLPSPAKSSTWSNHGDSTTADMTPANDTYFEERNMTVRTERAVTLYRQVQILVGVSISSLGAFSIFVLPIPALISLLIYLGSLALVGNLCIRWIMSEIQAMMHGQGIGPFLPAYIYDQLTEMSLHDWMTDTTWTQQYRHLMLYFIPGIPPERVDQYIDALAPQQTFYLRRRGLGHLFGEDFMRFIMGNEGFHRHLSHEMPTPSEVHLIRSLPPELMNEEESDLGSTYRERTIVSNRQINLEGQVNDIPPPPTIVSFEENTPGQLEDTLLNNAFMDMFSTYMDASVDAMTNGLIHLVDTWTPYVVRAGIGITSMAAGMGILRRNWTPTIANSSTMTLWLPTHQTLWTTAFIGGFTTGGFLLFQSNIRSIVSRRVRNGSKSPADSKG
jgi:hypothetical protein